MPDQGLQRATILHADLDSFYASVEQRDDPRLTGCPVIVGAGVVLAASYEAKAHGVATAMTTARALRLCPTARVLAPHFDAYIEASRAVFAVFDDTTPLVEPLSIDEAFLDVGGLGRVSGSPEEIGVDLRRRVRDEVGLPISVGVARTKFLAKVASGVAKPDGLVTVDPHSESEFLHPLPVGKLWGVGPATASKLGRRGIETVADVAALDEATLAGLVGRSAGRHLHALANHRDPRSVQPRRRSRSIGSQQALGSRSLSASELRSILTGVVDRVMPRLRAGDRLCRTVVLRLRFGDFERATRSRTLLAPTDSTAIVGATARSLLDDSMPVVDDRGITLLGISVTNLTDASAVQLGLPFEEVEPLHGDRAALDAALDRLGDRFGGGAVKRASLLQHRLGHGAPRLPDAVRDDD